jgi:hypothetical protein
VISGGLDILSTRHVTPDLQLEANPIVIWMGRSWHSVFLIKGLSSAIAAVAFFLGLGGLGRRSDPLTGAEGIVEMSRLVLHGRPVSLARLLIRWPEDWRAGLACGGAFLGTAPVFAGFFGATANMLHLVKSPLHLYLLCAAVTLLGVAINVLLIRYFLMKQVQAGQEN